MKDRPANQAEEVNHQAAFPFDPILSAAQVSDPSSLGAPLSKKRNRIAAVTLTELLCVLAILLILVALYTGAIARAYVRIKAFLGGHSI